MYVGDEEKLNRLLRSPHLFQEMYAELEETERQLGDELDTVQEELEELPSYSNTPIAWRKHFERALAVASDAREQLVGSPVGAIGDRRAMPISEVFRLMATRLLELEQERS